jgi:uncharacterized protein
LIPFAVNYSINLIQLLKEDQIQLNWIKCPDWEGMLQEARPHGLITIHFDLKCGLGETFQADLKRLKGLLHNTVTPHVNTHLVAPRNFDCQQETEVHRLQNLWRDEINILTDFFGGDRVALEHYPLNPTNQHLQLAVDPQIFSKVVLDTGCQFILDLAHARITADTQGCNVRDYIRALPVDRLVEVHVTGVRRYGGILTDHFEMQEADWNLLDWVIGEIKENRFPKPRLFAFEYGGVGQTFAFRSRKAVLKDQVPIFTEKLQNLSEL